MTRRRLITVSAVSVVVLAAVIGAFFMLASPFTATTESAAPPPDRAADSAPAKPSAPAEPAPTPAPVLPAFDAGQPPGTIRLPQGGTATLVRKEIDSSGTLPIPDGVSEATWWGAGLDATSGATVLAGHVNWSGEIGPFEELWESKQGQVVTVVDDTRKTYRYRVSEVVTVTKDELPGRAAELFSQGGPHRLVLVTCGGRYVGGDLGYDENRIVIATPM